MKLAICSVGELFGGVERHILGMCGYWSRQGWGYPMVILFEDAELAKQLRAMGIEPVMLKGKSRYDFTLVRELAGVLEDSSIDVVHAHGYKATIACALARRKTTFRLIKTEHGKREATLKQPVSWLKSSINFGLEQFLTRRYVDTICYVTHDIGRFFDSRHRGLSRAVVHNGIDPLDRHAYSRPDDLPEERVNVGIVGRVSTVKGIPVALEAMEKLGHLDRLHLVIIGTGPLLEELKQLTRSKGLEKRVHFLGFRANIYDYLAHLDVLLMPSYHEGLPYTLLEAMSLERPVLVSKVGGLQEVIQDGQTGLLCAAGEPGTLAADLERLLADPSSMGELGRRARKDQADHYSLQTMGDQYMDIYRGSAEQVGKAGAPGG